MWRAIVLGGCLAFAWPAASLKIGRVGDLAPGRSVDAPLEFLTALGTRAFFCVPHTRTFSDGQRPDAQLWVTDGTRRGTRMVRDISASSQGLCPQRFVDVGSTAIFATGSSDHWTLWTTDGTAPGTTTVTEELSYYGGGAGSDAELEPMPSAGGFAFFARYSRYTDYTYPPAYFCGGLERFDGTSIEPVDSVAPGSAIRFGDGLLYHRCGMGIAYWSSRTGQSTLLASSGADPAGAVVVADDAFLAEQTPPAASTVLGDITPDRTLLWKTRGTASSTVQYETLPFVASIVGANAGGAVLGSGGALWFTDGTRGTRAIPIPAAAGETWRFWSDGRTAAIIVAQADRERLHVLGADGAFAGGVELPAASGGALLVGWDDDLAVVRGVDVSVYDAAQNTLVPVARTPAGAAGVVALSGGSLVLKLQDGSLVAVRRDGTTEVLGSSSAPRPASSLPDPFLGSGPARRPFAVYGSRAIFVAGPDDALVAASNGDDVEVLARSSPVPGRSAPSRVIGRTSHGVAFVAADLHGPAVWTTDGTTAGTTRLIDESFDALAAADRDGRTYVIGRRADGGDDVWRVDDGRAISLSAALTHPSYPSLREAAFDEGSSHFSYNSGDFDLVSDAVTARRSSYCCSIRYLPAAIPLVADCWSDAECRLFPRDAPADAAPLDSFDGESMQWFTLLGAATASAHFYVRPGRFGGCRDLELWHSDGSSLGTRLVSSMLELDDRDELCRPRPYGLAAMRDLVLFSKEDAQHGLELWRTDGTPSGTVLVKDIVAGRDGSHPHAMITVGPDGPVVFTACDAEHGCEPWVSWGTAETTHMIADLEAGPASSWPAQYSVLPDRLDFSAEDAEHGREPWTISRDALGPSVFDIACPGDLHLAASDAPITVDLPRAVPVGDASGLSVAYAPGRDVTLRPGTTVIAATVREPGGREATCTYRVFVDGQRESSRTPPTAHPDGCQCGSAPFSALGLLLVLARRRLRR